MHVWESQKGAALQRGTAKPLKLTQMLCSILAECSPAKGGVKTVKGCKKEQCWGESKLSLHAHLRTLALARLNILPVLLQEAVQSIDANRSGLSAMVVVCCQSAELGSPAVALPTSNAPLVLKHQT